MATGFFFTVYTLSPLHAGAGQASGKVDLPIQREKHSNYPCVYATSLKGSLRDYCSNALNWKESQPDQLKKIFGAADDTVGAGGAIFTDLKILFFPIRSSENGFQYVTSARVLERFSRDYRLAMQQEKSLDVFQERNLLQPDAMQNTSFVLLEDYIFQKNGAAPQTIIEGIRKQDIYRLNEERFGELLANATQVIPRNQLDENKISENLWYEEALPADTVLYSFILSSTNDDAAITTIKTALNGKIVQIGGNETVGYGICKISAQ